MIPIVPWSAAPVHSRLYTNEYYLNCNQLSHTQVASGTWTTNFLRLSSFNSNLPKWQRYSKQHDARYCCFFVALVVVEFDVNLFFYCTHNIFQ